MSCRWSHSSLRAQAGFPFGTSNSALRPAPAVAPIIVPLGLKVTELGTWEPESSTWHEQLILDRAALRG